MPPEGVGCVASLSVSHPYGQLGFPQGLSSEILHVGPCRQQHNLPCHLLCQHWAALQHMPRDTPSRPLGLERALGTPSGPHYHSRPGNRYGSVCRYRLKSALSYGGNLGFHMRTTRFHSLLHAPMQCLYWTHSLVTPSSSSRSPDPFSLRACSINDPLCPLSSAVSIHLFKSYPK